MLHRIDRSLLLAIMFLIGLGIVQVYSSSFIFAIESRQDGHYFFKKQQYNFNSGMNLIRELGDYNLIYSIASFDPNPDLHFKMVTQINLILEAGDFLFNMFHDYFSQKSNINLPKIEKFTPYLFGLDSLKQKNLCLRGNNECY